MKEDIEEVFFFLEKYFFFIITERKKERQTRTHTPFFPYLFTWAQMNFFFVHCTHVSLSCSVIDRKRTLKKKKKKIHLTFLYVCCINARIKRKNRVDDEGRH